MHNIEHCVKRLIFSYRMCSNTKRKEQIFSMANRIRKLVYTIKELRDILNAKYLRLIYLAFVDPIISHRIIGWGGSLDNVLPRLQTSQNSFIRFTMKKKPRFHCTTLYKEFNVINIKQLYLN